MQHVLAQQDTKEIIL